MSIAIPLHSRAQRSLLEISDIARLREHQVGTGRALMHVHRPPTNYVG